MVARSDTAGLRQWQQNGSDSPHDIAFYPRYVLSPVQETDKAGVTHTLVPGRTRKKQIIAPSSDSLACACSIAYFASHLGNPGLLNFYVPFLNAIHRSVNSDPSPRTSSSSASSPSGTPTSVSIFAHSHLGLSSYIRPSNSNPDKSRCPPFSWPEKSSVALRAQIQAHLEFLDELLLAYCDDDPDPATRVLLVGHSIGCWLIQEMLKVKARTAGALRPRVGAYMLFPTISDIARSPNGRKLSVRTPIFRNLKTCSIAFVLLSNCECPAFLSPALATNTSVPGPTCPTRCAPLHPASPPALLAYKPAASRARLAAGACGYLRGADHGERRDGDGARTRHRLPPGLCAELVVLLCGGGRLGWRTICCCLACVVRYWCPHGKSRGTRPSWHTSRILY
jgi:hypothetical protein